MSVTAAVRPLSHQWALWPLPCLSVYQDASHLHRPGAPAADDDSFRRRVDTLPWPEDWDRWEEGSSPQKPSPAQVQAAVAALQRSLSAVAGKEVTWRDNDDDHPGQEPYLDPLDGLGVALFRGLSARMGLDATSAPQALLDATARAVGNDPVLQEAMSLHEHRFQQLCHFAHLYIPCSLGTVLVGLPQSIGSSSDLLREIKELCSALQITRGDDWFESTQIAGRAADLLLGPLTVLSDAASASDVLGLPIHLAW